MAGMKMTRNLAIVSVALVVAFAAGCGADDEQKLKDAKPKATTATTASTTATSGSPKLSTQNLKATVAGGSVNGGPTVWEVAKGDTIRIVVTSDTGDEIHVHGYDLHDDVADGSPSNLEFVADTPGVFEVELEEAGLLVGNLQVNP